MTTIQVHPAHSRRMAVPFRNSGGVPLSVTAGTAVCLGIFNILKQRSEGTRKSILMPNTQPRAESPLGT